MAAGKGVHVRLAMMLDALADSHPVRITIVDPKGGSEFGELAQLEGDRAWPDMVEPTDPLVWSEGTALLLEQAAERIETNGWAQGRFSDGPRLCTHAAILHSSPNYTHRQAAVIAFHHWLVESDTVGYYSGLNIAGWNDLPDTTQETVVAALRSAAAYTREKASTWTGA